METISAAITEVRWNRGGTVCYALYDHDGQRCRTAFEAEAGRMLEQELNSGSEPIRMTVFVDEIEPIEG